MKRVTRLVDLALTILTTATDTTALVCVEVLLRVNAVSPLADVIMRRHT